MKKNIEVLREMESEIDVIMRNTYATFHKMIDDRETLTQFKKTYGQTMNILDKNFTLMEEQIVQQNRIEEKLDLILEAITAGIR